MRENSRFLLEKEAMYSLPKAGPSSVVHLAVLLAATTFVGIKKVWAWVGTSVRG